ncbi:hypothetical protein NPIL_98001 [Nephila pilipes]|uniref:Uncharacterized protein n=1 Tax=Nephila pilipes TaxID=299642 RepID=A0A8X6IVA9_NEPPI|nr:hypothetical protein NPIL_98001 [Nephila pilipes]
MNSAVIYGFVGLLIAVSVQAQDANKCEKRKDCIKGQYCYKTPILGVELCGSYGQIGSLCGNENNKCLPELECKELKFLGMSLKTCQKSDKNFVDAMNSPMPEKKTTAMPSVSTDIPAISTNDNPQ